MDSEEKGAEDGNGNLPKANIFLRELSNWLTLASILLFNIYGILVIIYEIALDVTHIRWAFLGFLFCCVVDVISYWICRFAVSDGVEACLLRLVLILQIATGLFYLIAPLVVALTRYKFIPDTHIMTSNNDDDAVAVAAEDDKDYSLASYEDYKSPIDPCAAAGVNERDNSLWQCGYVNSIQMASWWMLVAAIPKFLIYYLILRILKVVGKK